jgi:hypothetical protein
MRMAVAISARAIGGFLVVTGLLILLGVMLVTIFYRVESLFEGQP